MAGVLNMTQDGPWPDASVWDAYESMLEDDIEAYERLPVDVALAPILPALVSNMQVQPMPIEETLLHKSLKVLRRQLGPADSVEVHKDWPAGFPTEERRFLAAPGIRNKRTNPTGGKKGGSGQPRPVQVEADGKAKGTTTYIWRRYNNRCWDKEHAPAEECGTLGHRIRTAHEDSIVYTEEGVRAWGVKLEDPRWERVDLNGPRMGKWKGKTIFKPLWVPTLIIEGELKKSKDRKPAGTEDEQEQAEVICATQPGDSASPAAKRQKSGDGITTSQHGVVNSLGLQPSAMLMQSPVACVAEVAAASTAVDAPPTEVMGSSQTGATRVTGTVAALAVDALLCSLGVPQPPPPWDLHLCQVKQAIEAHSLQAFQNALGPALTLDVFKELQHLDERRRSVLHLLLTPKHQWVMNYYDTGGSVEGDTGQVEYEMLKWLLGAMNKDDLHTLLLQTNNKSLSTPLHTASRHAAQRPYGHRMMDLLLQHCSMLHLAIPTSHGYLPPESAARSRDLKGVILYMHYAMKQVLQAGLKPTRLQVLVFAPKDKHFLASRAVEVLKQACELCSFLQPPSPPDKRTQQEHLDATFQLMSEVTQKLSCMSCSAH